jgi:hypothetical protein
VKAEDVYRPLIQNALAPIMRRAVHPETTYNDDAQYAPGSWLYQPGANISERNLARPGHKEKFGKKPLPPRERLAARLTLLMVLNEVELTLMREIKDDTEAIADAKAYGMEAAAP